MSQPNVRNQHRRPQLTSLVLLTALFLTTALTANVLAEDADGLALLAENPAITAGVLAALDEEGVAPVLITFNMPPIENGRYAHHPAAKTDIHPLLFEMVSLAEPGSVQLDEAGPSPVLQARMSVAALRALGDNPDIYSVEIDPSPVPERPQADARSSLVPNKLHCPCTPATGVTRACLQSGQWAAYINHGGTSSKVAAYSSFSAVFWTYNSANWEAVVKVINGCSVNNYWWVLAAAASSVSYTLTVEDTGFCPNYNTYSSSSDGNPILDTTAFPCS